MDIILDNFLLLVVKNRILYDIMKKANTYLFYHPGSRCNSRYEGR